MSDETEKREPMSEERLASARDVLNDRCDEAECFGACYQEEGLRLADEVDRLRARLAEETDQLLACRAAWKAMKAERDAAEEAVRRGCEPDTQLICETTGLRDDVRHLSGLLDAAERDRDEARREVEEERAKRREVEEAVMRKHEGECWKPLHGHPPPLKADACAICRRVLGGQE